MAGERSAPGAATALLLAGGLTLAAPAAAQIRFEDVAARAGVHHVVRNSETPQRYQIEPMIAGLALLDYDNDGRLDLFVCNGAAIPSLEKTDASFSNRLYRNGPGLVFEDVTERAGVAGAGYSMGVAAGDFDNDGWTDLYVTGVNRNILYHNRGDGTFEDVTASAGVAGEIPGRGKVWSVGAGWFDYDRDGDLDLFVVNYCVWAVGKDKVCGAAKEGYRTYCHPDEYDPLPNILYRNNGDHTFTDVSAPSGIGAHLGKGMGLAFADYDADGWPDVFVSNDAWRNFLFRNRGDGTFEETGLRAGVAYVDAGRPVSGMGADFRDYDGDGRPDIFMTALSNETFPLFRNEGNGMFREETYASHLGGQSLAWGGWSTGMVDLDDDGFLDLFVAGGHVQTNEELYSSRSSRQSNRVFRNLGDGTFRDVTRDCGADFQQVGLHRGAAFGDLDDDGRIDVVVTRAERAGRGVPQPDGAVRPLPPGSPGRHAQQPGRAGSGPASDARLGTIAGPARDRRRRIRRLQRQAGALRPGRRGPHPEPGDRLAERPSPGAGERGRRPRAGDPRGSAAAQPLGSQRLSRPAAARALSHSICSAAFASIPSSR